MTEKSDVDAFSQILSRTASGELVLDSGAVRRMKAMLEARRNATPEGDVGEGPRKKRQVVFFDESEWAILTRLARAHALPIGQYIRMIVAVNAISPERERVQASWQALASDGDYIAAAAEEIERLDQPSKAEPGSKRPVDWKDLEEDSQP